MMSQMELWNMQDYCEGRNEERKSVKRRASYSMLNLLVIIAGVVLTSLSVCLAVFIYSLSPALMYSGYMAIGILGVIVGLVIMIVGSAVK